MLSQNSSVPDGRQYLSPKEVSVFAGISKAQLEVWRAKGGGPKFSRIGKRVIKYRRDDVEAFIEGREAA